MNPASPRKNSVFAIYIVSFVLTLHISLLAYIYSSFLSKFAGEKVVGLIFSAGSLFTALAFIKFPATLRRLGNYKLFLILLAVDLLALLGLAVSNALLLAASLFVVHFVVSALVGLNLDIFLENYSTDRKTGRIRGLFLTIVNSAWVMGPLIAGFVLSNGDYWKIFVASAILILPVLVLTKGNLAHFKDPDYREFAPIKTAARVWKNKNLYRIFMANFLLQFFYALMVIYTPLYLHEHVGLSWSAIGMVFAVMLTPFVILQLPLGRLADIAYGEKEILSIGFLIMAVTTGLITFITSQSLLVWAAILFATRVGASMTEVMVEVYFFKQITERNVGTMSLFRLMRPAAYLVAPAIASAVFIIFGLPITSIFAVLALVMFYGLRYSLAIKDTL